MLASAERRLRLTTGFLRLPDRGGGSPLGYEPHPVPTDGCCTSCKHPEAVAYNCRRTTRYRGEQRPLEQLWHSAPERKEPDVEWRARSTIPAKTKCDPERAHGQNLPQHRCTAAAGILVERIAPVFGGMGYEGLFRRSVP